MPYEYGPYRKKTQKLNANCPDSEKTGTGPGSCGGSSGKKDESISEKIPMKVQKSAASSGTRLAKDIVASITGTDQKLSDIVTPEGIEEAVHSDYMDLVNRGKLTGSPAEKEAFKSAWIQSFKVVIDKYNNKSKSKK